MELLGSPSQIGQPQAPLATLTVDPLPIVSNFQQAFFVLHAEHDGTPGGIGMTFDVGYSFADGGHQMFCHDGGDRGIDRAVERDVQLEAHHVAQFSDEVGHMVTDASTRLSHAECIDSGSELGDDTVEFADLARQTLGEIRGRSNGQTLEAETDAEESLDDVIVQIAGQAISILEDGGNLDLLV